MSKHELAKKCGFDWINCKKIEKREKKYPSVKKITIKWAKSVLPAYGELSSWLTLAFFVEFFVPLVEGFLHPGFLHIL